MTLLMTDLMLNFDLRDDWWCDQSPGGYWQVYQVFWDHYVIKTHQPGVFADGQCRAKVYAVVSQDINVNISDFLSPKKGKRSKINNDFFKLYYISWNNKSLHGKTLLKY